MADGRQNNSGKIGNRGGGRKPKAEEEKLVRRLSEFDEDAFQCMINGIRNGEYNFWNKFMEYRYGKPKETIDNTHTINHFDIKELFKFDNAKE